jgi:hypothetical protein
MKLPMLERSPRAALTTTWLPCRTRLVPPRAPPGKAPESSRVARSHARTGCKPISTLLRVARQTRRKAFAISGTSRFLDSAIQKIVTRRTTGIEREPRRPFAFRTGQTASLTRPRSSRRSFSHRSFSE